MTDLDIERHDATGMHGLRADLLAVYTEVYAHEIADNPVFFDVDQFWERLTAYASRAGFSLVVGRVDGELIGYALGYRLPEGARWWRGYRGDLPADQLVEDGRRTFAICEIMVRPTWRRRGYAHALHDELLADRPESRATLLVEPDNAPAHAAYRSWGWREVGHVKPSFPDSPLYISMMRP